MPDDITFDEGALLQELKQGNELAFIEIYDHYKQPLYAFIIKFVKVPTHADDLLQDLFLKIWEVRSRIDTSLSFKAYLYRICRNLIYRYLKKTAQSKQLIDEQIQYFVPDESANSELKLLWKQYEENIRSAIDELPPRRREIFILCRQGKHTYDDVAKQLGISRNTVKEHMVLSMKSISQYLKLKKGIDLPIALLTFYFI